MERLKIERVESADVRVSNADNADRRYAIDARVSVSGGNVTGIHDGRVNLGDETVATFSSYMTGHLNFDAQASTENKADILAAIKQYCSGVRENATGIFNF